MGTIDQDQSGFKLDAVFFWDPAATANDARLLLLFVMADQEYAEGNVRHLILVPVHHHPYGAHVTSESRSYADCHTS